MIGTVLSVVGCVVVVAMVVGAVRTLVHRAGPVVGDPGVAAELVALAGRRARRVAAVVIDLNATVPTRMAFIGADADTPFEIGSVTKGLTGMLLANAIERGEADLDATLAQLLPETGGSPIGSVRLSELATHTSGLPRLPRSPVTLLRLVAAGYTGVDPYWGTTPATVIAAARRQRLTGRGRFRYSNLGAAVLGHGLARAAGRDYADLLKRRVFEPLRMTGSGTDLRPGVRRGWTAIGRRSRPWRACGYGPAGGGVTSTPADISRLVIGLLDGTAPGRAAINSFAPIEPGPPNRSSGLFWIIDRDQPSGRDMVWHNGQTGGYSAFLVLYPQARRAVAVLADTANAARQQRVALGLTRWLTNTAR
ncbi:serine hydrolase [Arthrobacter livingstonensis]|uniref:Serine hydrolase n=1 Tax=Arthrobacter livingstonensis TaxID=670078 RepID=A0A2V5L1X0_9MICC|nr:serine hydrolase [Arthrobacter livingstonensis]